MTFQEDGEIGRRGEEVPTLDAETREHLGRRLRELCEPVWDEVLDPRLAELLRALDYDRSDTD